MAIYCSFQGKTKPINYLSTNIQTLKNEISDFYFKEELNGKQFEILVKLEQKFYPLTPDIYNYLKNQPCSYIWLQIELKEELQKEASILEGENSTVIIRKPTTQSTKNSFIEQNIFQNKIERETNSITNQIEFQPEILTNSHPEEELKLHPENDFEVAAHFLEEQVLDKSQNDKSIEEIKENLEKRVSETDFNNPEEENIPHQNINEERFDFSPIQEENFSKIKNEPQEENYFTNENLSQIKQNLKNLEENQVNWQNNVLMHFQDHSEKIEDFGKIISEINKNSNSTQNILKNLNNFEIQLKLLKDNAIDESKIEKIVAFEIQKNMIKSTNFIRNLFDNSLSKIQNCSCSQNKEENTFNNPICSKCQKTLNYDEDFFFMSKKGCYICVKCGQTRKQAIEKYANALEKEDKTKSIFDYKENLTSDIVHSENQSLETSNEQTLNSSNYEIHPEATSERNLKVTLLDFEYTYEPCGISKNEKKDSFNFQLVFCFYLESAESKRFYMEENFFIEG